MNDFISIINGCYNWLCNTNINLWSFSFTLWDIFVATSIISFGSLIIYNLVTRYIE